MGHWIQKDALSSNLDQCFEHTVFVMYLRYAVPKSRDRSFFLNDKNFLTFNFDRRLFTLDLDQCDYQFFSIFIFPDVKEVFL